MKPSFFLSITSPSGKKPASPSTYSLNQQFQNCLSASTPPFGKWTTFLADLSKTMGTQRIRTCEWALGFTGKLYIDRRDVGANEGRWALSIAEPICVSWLLKMGSKSGFTHYGLSIDTLNQISSGEQQATFLNNWSCPWVWPVFPHSLRFSLDWFSVRQRKSYFRPTRVA